MQLPLASAPVAWPVGHWTLTPPTGGSAASAAVRSEVFAIVTRPAGCACEVVVQGLDGHGFGAPGALAKGAPRVLKRTPDDAVVSLDMTVLLMKSTTRASCNDTPPPSQPATLLAMMLLVTLMLFHPL